jgi:hypothetical protein
LSLHPSIAETFGRLEDEARGIPLLALGQTVFWDEPLKAILPILAEEAGAKVSLVAGVHDTDYFAKLPGGVQSKKDFDALPKNDGSTRDFWSAAGEFSALFGSETPVTRETLQTAGVSLDRVSRGNGRAIDDATEAWGWRGIAASDPVARVTSEVPIHRAFDEIQATFAWAMRLSRESLENADGATDEIENQLHSILCDARDGCPGQTLAEFYECMLPRLHRIVTGRQVAAEITRTGKLLRFDTTTSSLTRFSFVGLFLDPKTAPIAKAAYDDAVRHTEVYTLDRFGTGAIPFDLVIPGEGRGTVRLTTKMLIVMTPEPKFVKLEKPIESIQQLAAVTEEAFGRCVLVGKAITLIAMMASEFVFAFHEGASTYVSQTRMMLEKLRENGIDVVAHPILRISLGALDALQDTQRWLRLPELLRGPFGTDVVSAATIACSWRCVGEQQRVHLETLSSARNVSSLLECLQKIRGGRWERLREEFETLRAALVPLDDKLRNLDTDIATAHNRSREIKREWAMSEELRGQAFRNGNMKVREELGEKLAGLRAERREIIEKLRSLRKQKGEEANVPAMRRARERRQAIEREAEIARLRTVREAVTASVGLEKSNRRPAAWWFPLVTPDGSWFEGLRSRVQLRLEPLQ